MSALPSAGSTALARPVAELPCAVAVDQLGGIHALVDEVLLGCRIFTAQILKFVSTNSSF